MAVINKLQIKRIYLTKDEGDGYRILVDRLWPRGVKKEEAQIDLWLKEIAPSPDLRKWFNHDPERFIDFANHYCEELEEDSEKKKAVKQVCEYLSNDDVTLLYAAKDERFNHAIVLRDYIMEKTER